MKKMSLLILFLCLIVVSCAAEEIDVFKLAKSCTLQELHDAIARGLKFNVMRNIEGEIEDELDMGETPLHVAAAYNQNQGVIKFLVSQGLNVNQEKGYYSDMGNSLADTPLSCAVRHKNINAVRELLEAGADPNSYSCNGYESSGNPISIVVLEYDDNPIAKTVLKTLIQAGANVNDDGGQDIPSKFKKSYLLPRTKWINSDFRRNENEDLSNPERSFFYSSSTPLMFAVLLDKPNIVNTLLDLDANPNLYNAENKLALDYANELPDNSNLKNSPVFNMLKNATTVLSKANKFDPNFDRADKLVGEGKIPMYVRDKGKFFYNHKIEDPGSGRIAITAQKVNLRSQPNTKARIIDQIGREDTEKYPLYLGEWKNPQGDHWILGEYRKNNGHTEPVWIYGKYADVLDINSYYVRIHEIQAEQREIIEAVRNTMYYPPYTASNGYLPVGQQLEGASLGNWEWSISENGPSGFEKRIAVFRVQGRNRFNNSMIDMTLSFGRSTEKNEIHGLSKGDLALLHIIMNGEVLYRYDMEINTGPSAIDPFLRLGGGRSLNDELQQFKNNFGKLLGIQSNQMTARQFFDFIYTGNIR